MTINWGYKILILYVGFVAGMLFLVYKCTQQNIDLVAENYYEKEIKFQDQITRSNNVNTGGLVLKATVNESKQLIITYPAAVSGAKTSGEIHLFRPDNAKLDVKTPVDITEGLQYIDVSKLAKGYWRVQVSWQLGDTPLYQEERIFIQ